MTTGLAGGLLCAYKTPVPVCACKRIYRCTLSALIAIGSECFA